MQLLCSPVPFVVTNAEDNNNLAKHPKTQPFATKSPWRTSPFETKFPCHGAVSLTLNPLDNKGEDMAGMPLLNTLPDKVSADIACLM